MTAVETLNIRRLSNSTIALIAFVAMTLCAVALPITLEKSAAAAPPKLSVSLDGSSVLPVVETAATALAPAGSFPLSGILNGHSATLALGAPSTAQPQNLGCWVVTCILSAGVHIVEGAFHCGIIGAVGGDPSQLLKIFSGACKKDIEAVLSDAEQIVAWAVAGTIHQALIRILQGAEITAMDWSGWILRDMLGGGNSISNPVLSCKFAVGNQAQGCKDAWFLGQYNVMRQIALFMLLPLFMLVVIQSVITGRIYLLTRAAFIMLPAAIIGGVVAVFFGQLMLNLSDDFVNMIANYTTSTTSYADNFQKSVNGMDATKMNYFAFIWFFLLIFASIIIYIELLLRQVGVYMSAFFLPLGFAALVWPAAAGFFKKILELLLGLIFSKVFIAAAVALGITAFASLSTPAGGQPAAGAGGGADATSSGLASLITGTLIFCMAAFAGTKVIAMTPAAMTAAEGRVMPTQNWTSKLQMSNALMGRGAQLKQWHNSGRHSGKRFDAQAAQARRAGRAGPRAQRGPSQTGQGTPQPPPTRSNGRRRP